MTTLIQNAMELERLVEYQAKVEGFYNEEATVYQVTITIGELIIPLDGCSKRVIEATRRIIEERIDKVKDEIADEVQASRARVIRKS